MTRTRTTAALLATTAAGTAIMALAGLTGCPSTAATTLYTPITGLILDSASLVSGLGCGTSPGQVYKYAAIVSLSPDAGGALPGLPVSGVVDCFADGQFSNLPTPDGGTTTYNIAIYAFDQASFPEDVLGLCDYMNVDASCPSEDPALVEKYVSKANWSTTCTATQVQGVSEVAVCGSLVRTSDASLGPDEGTDAQADDASQEGTAGDASGGDAGEAGDGGLPGSEAGDAAVVGDGSGEASAPDDGAAG